MPLIARLALTAVLLGVSACGAHDGSSSASCADVIVYAGNTYEGQPRPDALPAGTGHVERATRPACDDGGGTALPAEELAVEQVVGVPMSREVLLDDRVYVYLTAGPVTNDKTEYR